MPGTLATRAWKSRMIDDSVSGSGPSRLTQIGRLKPERQLDARDRQQRVADLALERPSAIACAARARSASC